MHAHLKISAKTDHLTELISISGLNCNKVQRYHISIYIICKNILANANWFLLKAQKCLLKGLVSFNYYISFFNAWSFCARCTGHRQHLPASLTDIKLAGLVKCFIYYWVDVWSLPVTGFLAMQFVDTSWEMGQAAAVFQVKVTVHPSSYKKAGCEFLKDSSRIFLNHLRIGKCQNGIYIFKYLHLWIASLTIWIKQMVQELLVVGLSPSRWKKIFRTVGINYNYDQDQS